MEMAEIGRKSKAQCSKEGIDVRKQIINEHNEINKT